MDNGLVQIKQSVKQQFRRKVLILVVVDNGLVHASGATMCFFACVLILVVVDNGLVLRVIIYISLVEARVLILVVVDNGLVLFKLIILMIILLIVLILVVVDNGLVHLLSFIY